MRRGTTTQHIITPGIDLTSAKVFLTYVQGNTTVLERTNDDVGLTITADTITNTITQAESFEFTTNQAVKVQLRWVTADGTAGASNVFSVSVDDVLKQGEISYGTQYAISISGDDDVTEGDTLTLTASTTPSGETVDWASSDNTVATVEDGVVTALAAGSVTITASLHDHSSITATKTITVNAAE